MPGTAPPISSEREALTAYLVQQRDGLKYSAYGLSEDQLRARPTASQLTIGGLIKHAAHTERHWIQTMLELPPALTGADAYADTFAIGPQDTVESIIAEFDEVGAETTAAIADLDSLDQPITLPDAPWFPQGGGYTARWVLFHIVEELARHAGHADIIREHVDGATMYELLAGAEGWPETDWIKPWKPRAASNASR